MTKIEPQPAPASQPVEATPSAGGSYQRQEDGSLVQREGTKPAEPQLGTEPKKPE